MTAMFWLVLVLVLALVALPRSKPQEHPEEHLEEHPPPLYEYLPMLQGRQLQTALLPLRNKCFDSAEDPADWWQYVWCYQKHVKQIHFDRKKKRISEQISLGAFVEEESGADHHIYRSKAADCRLEGAQARSRLVPRYVEVRVRCCREHGGARAGGSSLVDRTHIEHVSEPVQCNYHISVCSPLACDPGSLPPADQPLWAGASLNDKYSVASMTASSQAQVLERVRAMFSHGYDSYLEHALPHADLFPISCSGGAFDLIKIPLVTLIDSLDMLAVMGNHSEFRRAAGIVGDYFPDFSLDVNVSVFETTIRVLGGLLSAHLIAIDPRLGVYPLSGSEGAYEGRLLQLARDLGERLLPAFRTRTGIPYGTVNLRYGVPRGETDIASTAGAGSLVVEMETLSSLTGDRRYGDAAYAATEALFDRRSAIGLLGKHISTRTGKWVESNSGIGSNSDSFYEYLIKAYLLFPRDDMFHMFSETYRAIKKFVQSDEWFSDVDMFNGKLRRQRVENLQAYWPGVEALLGLTSSGSRLLNSFYAVWVDLGFLPEEFDYAQWQQGKPPLNPSYPLRPELIESTYYQYRATGDRSWLLAGRLFLESIENNARTRCGYAAVADISSMELDDVMPSFFLSETCKYLYLLFDEGNFVHSRDYIFSTEAHLFDPKQLPPVNRSIIEEEEEEEEDLLDSDDDSLTELEHRDASTQQQQQQQEEEQQQSEEEGGTGVVEAVPRPLAAVAAAPLLLQCTSKQWWAAPMGLDVEFLLAQEARGGHRMSLDLEARRRGGLFAPDEAEHLEGTAAAPLLTRPPQRRSETCFPEEEPQPEPPPKPKPPPGAQHSVEVTLDRLGVFTVQVYPDGFVVSSQQYKDTLEISNVGQNVIFVRDIGAASTQTVVAQVGLSMKCSVSVIAHPSIRGPGHRLPPRRIAGTELLWRRACSTAMYVPAPARAVEAELVLAEDDPELCRPRAQVPVAKRWMLWGRAEGRGQLEGRVVLGRRGGCMFEDKTMVAQSANASGLIIANNENFLFIMSGKKDDEEVKRSQVAVAPLKKGSPRAAREAATAAALEAAARRQGAPPRHHPEARLPTVMLAKDDAEALTALLTARRGGRGDTVLRARIDVDAVPAVLDLESLGYTEYPKLRMRENMVHVSSRSGWGVALTSTNGQEWQLFLLGHRDAELLQLVPHVARTARGHEVSFFDVVGASGSVALSRYRQLLQAQCPADIGFDSTSGTLILMDNNVQKGHRQ